MPDFERDRGLVAGHPDPVAGCTIDSCKFIQMKALYS
jgi:hypothetical protein